MKCDRRWWNDGRLERACAGEPWAVMHYRDRRTDKEPLPSFFYTDPVPVIGGAPFYARHPSHLMRIALPKPIDSVPPEFVE